MKKIIWCGVFFLLLFCLTGCANIEMQEIYTTVYPIQFLTETLYGEHSHSSSIYPSGTDISSYQLTDKLIDTYSKGSFFIYNGTAEEKQIAKTLVNKRKQLKIVDVAYGLKVKYGVEELWLSPSNFLMLATNLKNGLEDQIGTKYINEEMDGHFKELEETLSIMDADIRSAAKASQGRGQNRIIASSNVFKFLNDYGYSVLSLEDYEIGTPNYEALKSQLKSGTYRYVLTRDVDQNHELITSLVKDTGAETVIVNTMLTLSEEDQKNNNNYFTIMNDFVSDLKTITNY